MCYRTTGVLQNNTAARYDVGPCYDVGPGGPETRDSSSACGSYCGLTQARATTVTDGHSLSLVLLRVTARAAGDDAAGDSDDGMPVTRMLLDPHESVPLIDSEDSVLEPLQWESRSRVTVTVAAAPGPASGTGTEP